MATQSPTTDTPGWSPPVAVPGTILLAALWIGGVLLGGGPVEMSLIREVHVNEQPLLGFVILATRLGDWEMLLALPFFAAAWLLLRRNYRAAVFCLAVAVGGRLLVELQKALLGRLRPDEFDYMVSVVNFAFPSAHAANAMIVYPLLVLLLVREPQHRRWAFAAAVLLALLIGVSRVLLGVHWPSDVIGGWSFGLLWLALCFRFFNAQPTHPA